MKRLTLILLIVTSVLAYGQDTYESTVDSYRRNFLLTINEDKVTLYGWELTEGTDTLTYKAFGHLSKDKHVTLDNYEFSKLSPSQIKWDQFQSDNGVSISSFFLHRHLSIQTLDREKLEVLMAKDAYDSRVDKFVFKRRK